LWLWGVPASIAGIVAQHHPANPDTAGANDPATIVHLADRIVRGGEEAPDSEYLSSIGLSPALLRLPEWSDERLGRSPLNHSVA
jgi:hypothetical protein